MNRREALQALVALPTVQSVAVADVKPTDVIVRGRRATPLVCDVCGEYAHEHSPNCTIAKDQA